MIKLLLLTGEKYFFNSLGFGSMRHTTIAKDKKTIARKINLIYFILVFLCLGFA
jgi:hypothetical protein